MDYWNFQESIGGESEQMRQQDAKSRSQTRVGQDSAHGTGEVENEDWFIL